MILGALGIWQRGGIHAIIVVAFIGAVILVWITRLNQGGLRVRGTGSIMRAMQGFKTGAPYLYIA